MSKASLILVLSGLQRIEKVTTLKELEKHTDETTGIPPLMNPPILEATDDLTMLSHLNEPAGMSILDTGTHGV